MSLVDWLGLGAVILFMGFLFWSFRGEPETPDHAAPDGKWIEPPGPAQKSD
jgi:hypothetical protein